MGDTQRKGTQFLEDSLGVWWEGRNLSESQVWLLFLSLKRAWRIEPVFQNEDLSLDPRQDQSAASMKGVSLRTWGKLGAELTRNGRQGSYGSAPPAAIP